MTLTTLLSLARVARTSDTDNGEHFSPILAVVFWRSSPRMERITTEPAARVYLYVERNESSNVGTCRETDRTLAAPNRVGQAVLRDGEDSEGEGGDDGKNVTSEHVCERKEVTSGLERATDSLQA